MPNLAQLREEHNANRTELYKQFSIISAAGMGFNLVETLPKEGVFCGSVLVAWWLSTVLFLTTIISVMFLFYQTARKAEIESYLLGVVENAAIALPEDALRAERQGIVNRVRRTTTCILFSFTFAIFSAIFVVYKLYF